MSTGVQGCADGGNPALALRFDGEGVLTASGVRAFGSLETDGTGGREAEGREDGG